ncbi:MAG TPA: leucine--tRNA ligase [Chitinophagales bacterium]|mgnify:CR=1 FL=1|jgi:leucyl-tRNA synthetase|nr:leucine--tRNA ligase [Chitinophagales bacterium]HQW80063.1 leucine--tRNA ligase [Chitinophagales bacterium]
MEYNFSEIEQLAQQKWQTNNVYKVDIDTSKPKYYVLDMFPYPSGAGLHVGHPLGYIFSDIYARYKRMKGFNVLHPMGFDAFGLPAEQYAIQTGQHPEITTKNNIKTYISQLKKIGFSYDWSRQVTTCEPQYYKHTQWIFSQLFNSWYNNETEKAENINQLISIFKKQGNENLNAACEDGTQNFTAEEWNTFSQKHQQSILMEYRLAFQKESFVNWCPALGTVLANDEIVNGVSERGGHPVEKKRMSQWFLRITAYAERLLKGLDTLDWTESMKDMQRNWIGKSIGAMVSFPLKNKEGISMSNIDVFTTRVDTIFGVSFVVIAPEHELVNQITTVEFKNDVDKYVKLCASKSDIERQAEKQVSGQFTGAYVLHPFTHQEIPIFIADYVLAGYGTGAVMAVPSGDQRDYLFAQKYNLPIIPILDAQQNIETQADATKEGIYINSDFINGLNYQNATSLLIQKLQTQKVGYGKINYKMRDAGYSRQRYWGEPFPIYYDKDGLIHAVNENTLPITLPKVDSYKPTGTGESPLATAADWVQQNGEHTRMETDTMPGYAGSSWYFLRYMDPQNENEMVSKQAQEYWQNVDFYVGGSEHAVGHLLYARFWHKFLKDIGKVSTEEPFQKMVNQGMIGGRSLLTKKGQIKNVEIALHIPVMVAQNDKLFKDKFQELKQTDNRFENINIDDVFWENDKDGNEYISLDVQLEKMSKRYLNVVNPDDMVAQYGADTFRMYEMFLGPIDTAKPWDTNGISGVSNFIRKFWRLFYDDLGNAKNLNQEATSDELKILHKTIKRIQEDIERLAFNTCVSTFMIAVNDLSKLKSVSVSTLLDLIKLMAPFAPHTCEVLWSNLGQEISIVNAAFPNYDEQYLVESSFNYPIQINGKHRANIEIALDMSNDDIKTIVLADEKVQKFLEGNEPKKFIVVQGRIINVVV